MNTFKLKLPFDVEYIHLIECYNYHKAEKTIHQWYKPKRVNGSEFFALTPEDVAEIKAIKEL